MNDAIADRVVVWGNCQAAPLADLLTGPLAAHGLTVEPVPPVYLVDGAALRRVRELVARCRFFVAQPVSDEYRVAGCGTDQLATLLPRGSRLVRVPAVYDTAAFPFQSRGYDAAGRVDAPLTDYHDLRMLLAAVRGLSPQQTERWWPHEADPAAADASLTELRRRERGADITISDAVREPDSLWTMTHPANRLLATMATRVLDVLGVPNTITEPQREYLGERRTPTRRPGWTCREDWLIAGETVPRARLAREQLAFYARRPDVVTATLSRYRARLDLLGLA